MKNRDNDQAETYININIKDIRKNKKEENKVSALSPKGQPGSEETLKSPGLYEPTSGTSFMATPLLEDKAQAPGGGQEGSGLDIHYAKITTRRNRRNGSLRKKINFDFVRSNSNKINKLTFNTTPKAWEWQRDLERDYKLKKLTEQDWTWYQRILANYELIKQQHNTATIGKGNLRGDSQPVRQTACIYAVTEVIVYIQDWEYIFELEIVPPGPAERYYDSWAEYWNDTTAGEYIDPIWM